MHHSDSNPLSIVFDFDKSHVSVNETVNALFYFVNSDGKKFLGKLIGLDRIYLQVNENLRQVSKYVDDNSISIKINPKMAAKYIIFSYLYGYPLKEQRLNVN